MTDRKQEKGKVPHCPENKNEGEKRWKGRGRCAWSRMLIVFVSMSLFTGCRWPQFLENGMDVIRLEDLWKDWSHDDAEASDNEKGAAGAEQDEGAGDTRDEKASNDGAAMEGQDAQSEKDFKYAYAYLTEQEKTAYDRLLTGILNYEETIELDITDTDTLMKIFEAVMADRGDLFWVYYGEVTLRKTWSGKTMSLRVSPKYLMEEGEKEEKLRLVEATAKEWLSGLNMEADDYEKAKYVFETLAEQVEYKKDVPDQNNILSVFLNGETVCMGYACAAQYMLRQLGIPSTIVTGEADNGKETESHAWNLVKLNGAYCHMDVTWGDSMDDMDAEGKSVNYNYLCMTDMEILQTHKPAVSFSMPECNSVEYNYYIREGLYFDSWDPDSIGALFARSWKNGNTILSVKFSDEELLHKTKEYFIEQQKIADYCSGIQYVYYMESPEFCTITVNFS